MEIIRDIQSVKPHQKGHVIVIGNFDGVHRGHQYLFEKGRFEADRLGKKLYVLTFEPHPRAIFRPDEKPFRLTPGDIKLERLEESAIDGVVVLDFNWDFASLSAQQFIDKVLKNGLEAVHVIVGDDFCFGQLRKGSPDTIAKAGISIDALEKKCDGNIPLSSSYIRQSLRYGHINEANHVLGWDWEIRGEIVKGDQRGRELGYPTANVPLGHTVHPAYGIYAAWVMIEGEDKWRPSATNIGIRPMFEIPTAQVESFIFDFDEEIYGKILRIKPVKRLRGEAKFDSLDALIAQMDKDCQQAREILKEPS